MWRDPRFAAALVAGPLVWLVLISIHGRPDNLLWPLNAPWRLAWFALVVPVLEELAFRGLIQGSLLRARWGKAGFRGVSVANVLTSALFAALHLIRHSPLWAAATFFPSLVFGYFRDRHRTLSAPVVLHCFYNAGYFWLFPALSA